MEEGGYVYILASKGKRLYTGVTSHLHLRVQQHKSRKDPNSFTARYSIDQLVWYRGYDSVGEAIAWESKVKNLHRREKIALIVALNPDWKDLSAPWGKPTASFSEEAMRPPNGFGQDHEVQATATANTEILASPE